MIDIHVHFFPPSLFQAIWRYWIEYNEAQRTLEGLVYIGELKKKKDSIETRKKALLGRVCAIDRRGIGFIIFHARDRARNHFFLWDWNGQLRRRLCLTRDYFL
jgi:hypothetical protein